MLVLKPKSERRMSKAELFTKRCTQCPTFVPDEYEVCDRCLVAMVTEGEFPDVGGCCSCYGRSYSADQVARFIRYVLGWPIVSWGKT